MIETSEFLWCKSANTTMPLGPYMIHSVVRIIGDQLNKDTEKFERKPMGTGFYVRVPSEAGGGHYTYIVTAHHVIDGQPNPDLVFPDPYHAGQLYPAQKTEGPDWKQPLDKVDLAVLPYARPQNFFVNALEVGNNIWPGLPPEALLAMPFHYIGLLAGEVDRAMARSGTLGAIYQDDLPHTDDYEYTCHLGDCRSYGGFSGSPCFLEIAMTGLEEIEPPMPPEPGLGKVGAMKYAHPFCGMVTEHLEAVRRPESSLVGVVTILPNDYIWKALIESPDIVKERQEKDATPSEPETAVGVAPPPGYPRSGRVIPDHDSISRAFDDSV